MWAIESRGRYDGSKLRYPSDLTDAERAFIDLLIPSAKPGSNKRHVDEREIVNGLRCILITGCQWAALPKDASSALHGEFQLPALDRRPNARQYPPLPLHAVLEHNPI
ncbi:transposase [Acetobacter fallax]|uniref:Transposase n=1 Tax=Acetobacter fallax TaxID=1737473 RepID=A0ABX0KH19_9PROT|nr:transposase [Acetobacter fallax]NHO34383.1 transposase [Acetobacter fallax]NHO37945.1 transposase [Acetobacter fallax]